MRKFPIDELPAPIIALVKPFEEVVQFNWVQFLSAEFLTNSKEAQEKGKTFHYAWLLLNPSGCRRNVVG